MLSKEAFLESLKNGSTNTVNAEQPQEEQPVIPKPAGADEASAPIREDRRVDEAIELVNGMKGQLSPEGGLTPMQIVAILTRASKKLSDFAEGFNDEASAEFNRRIALDPDATSIVVAEATFTRNQDRVSWKYSPAVKELQEEEKKNGKATQSVVKAKKAFKISV